MSCFTTRYRTSGIFFTDVNVGHFGGCRRWDYLDRGGVGGQLTHLGGGRLAGSGGGGVVASNIGLDDVTHLHEELVQMPYSKAEAEYVLHQEHRHVLVVQMPDDEAYDKQRKIDDDVVDDLV